MLIKTTVTLQDEHIFGWHTKVHSQRQNSVASIDHSCLESGKKKKKEVESTKFSPISGLLFVFF